MWRSAGDVSRPAVDRHLVPPFDEPRRQLLGEGLEATVVSRDAAGSEYRELQFGLPSMPVDLSLASPKPTSHARPAATAARPSLTPSEKAIANALGKQAFTVAERLV